MSHPANFKDPTILGIWGDRLNNIYVADYSGQIIKRVSPLGKVEVIVYSKSPWSPVGGLIDDQSNLWVLENDSENKVRVRKIAHHLLNATGTSKTSRWNNALPLAILVARGNAFYFIFSSRNNTVKCQS